MVARRLVWFAIVIVACSTFGFSSRAAAQGPPPPCQTGCVAYAVSVSPAGTAVAHWLSTTDTAVFTITNTGLNSDNFTPVCGATGGVTCVSQSVDALVILAPNASAPDTVVYTVGASVGTLTLTATGTHSESNEGWWVITAQPTVTLVAPVLTSGSRAVVHTRQPLLRALFGTNGSSIDTTKTRLIWRTDTVTSFHADSLSTARQNRGLVEWDVDSTRWLAVGDSALVTATACAQNGLCTTVTRWAVLLNDQKPVLGFSGVPLEALGRQFGAPFGPGLSVSGPDVQTGLSLPPYFSMNAARSAGLVYSTRQSYPRAVVPVDIELPWPNGTPTKLHVTLFDGATRLDSLVLTSPSCLTGSVHRCRAVLQGDFSGSTFATPTRKWLTVQVQVDSGTTTQFGTDSVEVVLVDRRTTPYGSGWWPSGMLKLVAAGNDRLLVGPTGAATIYRGNGDSLYLSSPGDFGTLITSGGGWELHFRGSGAKLIFDANGRLWKSVDANGNVDSLHYSGTSDQVTAIVDRTGHAITLGYDGNGNLHTFTDPGSRISRITVNGTTHQLTSDSLASPASRTDTAAFVYQGFSGTGTVVLTQTIGVLGDTTVVTYDSTFKRRPSQVTLPTVATDTNAAVKPVIQYTPVERRGVGALVALTGTWVQLTDPRGNWARSLLNRWGQARWTTDTLGVLDSVAYTPDGLVRYVVGKTGDSSRVFTNYDSQWRPVRTWYLRSAGHVYRADSLVYDTLSRVIQVVDPQGQIAQTTYDAKGNVTQVSHPNFPGGDQTSYWYAANGLMDSTRLPGAPVSRRFTYDVVLKNLSQSFDEDALLIAQRVNDAMGRPAQEYSRLRVQMSGSTVNWQWRQTQTYLEDDNSTDSVVILRTDNCADPCSNLDFLTWPIDSQHVQHVSYTYDRGGRDTLRLNDRGNGPRYRYDRLGRLLVRYPWASNTTVRDSLVYDIAGNLRKTITRRGDTLTTSYDTRNRDTLTVIPGVGNLRRRYTGPADQLTASWYDSPVDSIGAVNARLASTFDQHGRLVSDTSYGGTTARTTAYTYDSLERVSAVTDPLGTWTMHFEIYRGFVDTLTTPMGDTLAYTCDMRGRCGNLAVRNAGARLARVAHWNKAGTLDSVTTTVQAGPSYVAGKEYRREATNDANPFLLPVFRERHDSLGTGQHTFADTVVYDGWGRLGSWFAIQDSNPSLTHQESYTFDRTNNLLTVGATQDSFDITTDRLAKRVTGTDTLFYTYDNAGNLVKALHRHGGTPDSTLYAYDALNQLRSVRHDTTLIVRYAYDVSGRRIAKRVYSSATGGTVAYTRFSMRGGSVGFETDSAGNIGFKYTWGSGVDNLVAVDSGSNHYYAVLDKLGTVRELVKKDGTWLWSTWYSPYGNVLLHDSSATVAGPRLAYGWTGRELDRETGFYFLRARYYDPGTARFTQEDPAGYGGGGNVYAYGAAPLDGTDPSGMLFNWTNQWHPWLYTPDIPNGPGGADPGVWGAGGAAEDQGLNAEEAAMYAQGNSFMAWEDYLKAFSETRDNEADAEMSVSDNPNDVAAGLAMFVAATNALSFTQFQQVTAGIDFLIQNSVTSTGSINGMDAATMLATGFAGVNDNLLGTANAGSVTLDDGKAYLWINSVLFTSGGRQFIAGRVEDMAQTVDHEMYHQFGPPAWNSQLYDNIVDSRACVDIPTATRCTTHP